MIILFGRLILITNFFMPRSIQVVIFRSRQNEIGDILIHILNINNIIATYALLSPKLLVIIASNEVITWLSCTFFFHTQWQFFNINYMEELFCTYYINKLKCIFYFWTLVWDMKAIHIVAMHFLSLRDGVNGSPQEHLTHFYSAYGETSQSDAFLVRQFVLCLTNMKN